jgi:hypothetical protein
MLSDDHNALYLGRGIVQFLVIISNSRDNQLTRGKVLCWLTVWEVAFRPMEVVCGGANLLSHVHEAKEREEA